MEMSAEALAEKGEKGSLTELLGYLTRRLGVDERRDDVRVPGLRHARNKVMDMLGVPKNEESS